MIIGRFKHRHKAAFWGMVDQGLGCVTETSDPFSAKPISFGDSGSRYDMSGLEILCPCEPSKVICAGLNYVDHAQELDMELPLEPLIFLKPPTALLAHDKDILYPSQTQRVDYEAELAVVIKKRARNICVDEARDYIFGCTCANDVTARDLQKRDGQWTRAKSFDTFCPLGPFVYTDINPGNLSIKTLLNGEIKQDSSTSRFIFDVNKIVSFVSSVMTLEPQDVILTGTPPGVGPMLPGDTVEIVIEGMQPLRNRVA